MLGLNDEIRLVLYKIDENEVESLYLEYNKTVKIFNFNVDNFEASFSREEPNNNYIVTRFCFYRQFEVSEELKKKFNLE